MLTRQAQYDAGVDARLANAPFDPQMTETWKRGWADAEAIIDASAERIGAQHFGRRYVNDRR